MTKTANWAFVLTLAATIPVLAQDYVIAVDASNGATCGAPPFAVVPQAAGFVSCGRLGYFHWTAVGAGWSTAFTLSNPTSSDMIVQVALLDTNGSASPNITMVRNGTSLGLKNSDTQLLPKRGALRWELPSAVGASETGGQVLVQVLAKNGLSLQSVLATEDYSYTNSAGIVYSTVSQSIGWVDQAQASYTATFEESSADSSLGSFAVKDMSGSAAGQTVDVQALDVNGNVLGDKKVVLTAGQVFARTVDDYFGPSTFSSLAPTRIARLLFTGADRISVLMLQVRGQSLASMPATAVLEP